MKRLVSFIMLLVLALASVAPAMAHPLGNFSVNRYSRIEVERDEVRLRYVLDLAEIPTLQEVRSAGLAAEAGEAARAVFLAQKARELANGAHLTVNGAPVIWSLRDQRIFFTPGQADLDVMRVELTLFAPVPVKDGAPLQFRDENYPGRAGWHEVVIRPGSGVILADASASSIDQTSELREYPQEAERAPLDVSSAVATVRWGDAPGTTGAGELSEGSGRARFGLDPKGDQLTGLLREGAAGGGPITLLLALLVAVGLGALHALEPGHGKTVVGGYLIGSRGTVRHAVLLGLTVTITHTIGVYALGLVTLVAAQWILPERLYPVLSVASGLMLALIGLSLVRNRLAGLHPNHAPVAQAHAVEAGHAGPDAPDHGHVHDHDHREHDHGAHDHDHDHDAHDHGHDHHEHSHDPGHGHSHADHQHPHGAHDHAADGYEHGVPGLVHTHGGGRSHTHAVPGADGAPITPRSLIALGVSGGLLPCPSALVVLLAAISLHSVVLGMLLVAAFSVGLAAVLTSIGVMVVYGGRALSRTRGASRVQSLRVVRLVPTLSAGFIMVAGIAIAVQAIQTFA